MIARLRRKFILILMGVVSLILLVVFLALLLSTWSNVRVAREGILRQALRMDRLPGGGPRGGEGQPFPTGPMLGARAPILVAQADGEGGVTILTDQLHFLEEGEAEALAYAALSAPGESGLLGEKALCFLKSEDGTRVALTDASAGQEMLVRLALSAAFIGSAALGLFFLVSLWLSRWAVRPVELAWQRQRRFVADASHELKTPLTVILSNAELLDGDGSLTNEKGIRRMGHIRAEALHMKKLVEDLLTLARSDSEEGGLVRSRVDLSFLVADAVLTMEPLAYDEGKRLTSEVEEGLFLMGDPRRLRELAGILLDNARKYAPSGGRIHVSLSKGERKGLSLTVFNEGEAIPREELEQIFLRFYRLDQARSSRDSYGLGLAIAQEIVRAHGGRIWAESMPGEGNRFHVALSQG